MAIDTVDSYLSTSRDGLTIKFLNGWKISIRWGLDNYGSKSDDGVALTGEVRITDPAGKLVPSLNGEDDFLAYQSPDKIAKLIIETQRRI